MNEIDDSGSVGQEVSSDDERLDRTTWLIILVTSLLVSGLLLETWWNHRRVRALPELRQAPAPDLYSLDVNQAEWTDWAQLPGIGPAMAHRIVADRNLNGDFMTPDDLLRVDGIGPTTLGKIRPFLSQDSHDRTALRTTASGDQGSQ